MKIKVGNELVECASDHTYRTPLETQNTCFYCGDKATRVGNETDEVLCDDCIDGYTLEEVNQGLKSGKME